MGEMGAWPVSQEIEVHVNCEAQVGEAAGHPIPAFSLEMLGILSGPS